MTSDVRAIGLKSLGPEGLWDFGTGTIVAAFQMLGILWVLRDDLKMSVKIGASCSAQCLSTLPQTLSGPGLFLGLQFLKRCKTTGSLIKSGGEVGGVDDTTRGSLQLPLSKRQKKVLSWLAISRPSLPWRSSEAFPLPLWGTFVMVLIPCHTSLGLPDVRAPSIFWL